MAEEMGIKAVIKVTADQASLDAARRQIGNSLKEATKQAQVNPSQLTPKVGAAHTDSGQTGGQGFFAKIKGVFDSIFGGGGASGAGGAAAGGAGAGGAAGGGAVGIAAVMYIVKGIYDAVMKVVSILAEASPMLQASLKLLWKDLMMILRPIGDLLGWVLMPLGRLIAKWNRDAYMAAFASGAQPGSPEWVKAFYGSFMSSMFGDMSLGVQGMFNGEGLKVELDDIIEIFAGFQLGLGPLAFAMPLVVDSIMGALTGLGTALGNAWQGFEGWVEQMTGFDLGGVLDALGGLLDPLSNLGSTLGSLNIGQTVMDALKNALGGLSGALAPLGTWILDTLKGALGGGFGILQGIGSWLSDTIKSGLGTFGNLSGMGQWVLDTMKSAMGGIGTTLNGVGQWVLDTIKGAVGPMTETVAKLGSWLYGAIQTAIGNLTSSIGNFGTWLYGTLQGTIGNLGANVGNFGSWLYGKLQTALGGLQGSISGFGSWLYGQMQGGASNVWSSISGFGSWLWGKITGGIGTLSTSLGGLGTWIYDQIVGALNSLTTLFSGWGDFFKNTWNGVVDALQAIGIDILGQHITPFAFLPKLASGGIVEATPGGTPVLVGEGGKDEAIIPLDKGGMGGSVQVNLNLYGNIYGVTDFKREVLDIVEREWARRLRSW